jgi:DNA-binding NtrC family response regulator
VNLGGISPALFESEMFGHVKGAFTDAYQSRKGRFELADGGTIFLDEIGDLDPSAQVKLLRILQDRTYEVLGSSETRTVDVRVVSATNRDLPALVAKGEFREDLLYRLNLIALRMPPLRERAGDAALLASDLVVHLARVYRRPNLAIDGAALGWLGRQSWPGNVRQLRQVIERAVLVADGDLLTRDDLARALDAGSDERAPLAGEMTLDEMERRMIVSSLERYGGNVTRVAEALGLSRPALYRRLEKYGISP